MYQLSVWAARNKWSARFLIITGWIALNFLAVFIASVISAENFEIPGFAISITVIAFLAGVFFYPQKRSKQYHSYINRKICDSVLVITSFFMAIGFFSENTNNFVTEANASIITTSTAVIHSKGDPVKKIKKSRELRSKIKAVIREIKKAYRSNPKADKTILIILSVLGAIVLMYLLVAVSCSIACSGSEGLAYVVFFAGLTGIIFLLCRVIRGINRKYNPRIKAEEQPKKS